MEIQIRTIAMDFWASLEHELHYKLSEEIPDGVAEELAQCAGIIAETDRRMEAHCRSPEPVAKARRRGCLCPLSQTDEPVAKFPSPKVRNSGRNHENSWFLPLKY